MILKIVGPELLPVTKSLNGCTTFLKVNFSSRMTSLIFFSIFTEFQLIISDNLLKIKSLYLSNSWIITICSFENSKLPLQIFDKLSESSPRDFTLSLYNSKRIVIFFLLRFLLSKYRLSLFSKYFKISSFFFCFI